MNISRREFIAVSGLFALSAGRVRGNQKESVAVLGAGLAGLSTAYQLAKKGFEVTVIEARNRVGGRVFTLRTHFDDGLYTETGGELFADNYKRFLGYADEFGIEYSELNPEAETGGSVSEIQDGIGRNAYMKGRFFRKGDVIQRHPYGLKGEESQMLPPTLLGKYLRLINNEIRTGKITLADLDRLSLAEALRSRGVSKKAVELIDISLNYNSANSVSAAGVVYDGIKRRGAGTVPLRMEGGNDQITEALAAAAERSGARVLLDSPVTKIDKTGEKIAVWYGTGAAGFKKLDADRVVCTIPFSVLRGIPMAPAFDPEKLRAINELGYTRVTKVYMQAKYAEWDKRSLGSSVWTDTPIERIFSTTGKPGDFRGLFTVWTDGDGSGKLQKMNPVKRMSYAVSKFEKVLPFMSGAVEKSATISWSDDPFSKGAYSHFKVGQFNSLSSVIPKPVGRIHFAGEHTAVEMPGMEGALESAERVVKEITG